MEPTERKIFNRLEEEAAFPLPQRPVFHPKVGVAAAMEEYRHFKAAGMLVQWRERWRHVLDFQ